MDWYRKSVDETARALGTEAAVGLTGAEAAARLEKHGPNALKQAKKRALWQMYLAQLKDVMVLVLLAAALISLYARGALKRLDQEGTVARAA